MKRRSHLDHRRFRCTDRDRADDRSAREAAGNPDDNGRAARGVRTGDEAGACLDPEVHLDRGRVANANANAGADAVAATVPGSDA